MKRILATFLAVVMVCALLPATAWAADSDFVINENGVLTKYNGPGGDVTIPDGVIGIGYNAFSGRTDVTCITIPASVTSIGYGAFYRCTGLTSVTIPGNVSEIGDSAFRGCTALADLTISAGVTNIERFAFYECTSLTSVTIPDSVTTIRDSTFNGCTSLADMVIPASVTDIGSMAFYRTPWLSELGELAIVNNILLECHQTNSSKVTIPDTVNKISGYAFWGCMSLTNVVIPDGVTSIGESAFGCLKDLTSVTIPASVVTIGGHAFDQTPWLLAMGDFPVVNDILLQYQGPGGDVVIPDSVTSIADRAFYSRTDVTNVTLPDGVTTIGRDAFSGCIGLTNVTIPASVASIGEYAFFGCNENLTVYGYTGSEAERYCGNENISFVSIGVVPGVARTGTMESASGESVSWDVTEEGEVAVDTAKLAQGEKVLVGCYNSAGKLTGLGWIDAQDPTARIDPKTQNVKLFWLNGAQAPQSASVTVWGK